MYSQLLFIFWLLLVPAVSADSTIESLFLVKKDTDAKGGCASYLPDPLETYLSEAKDLVNAGLQVLADANNPSAAEYDVARRYLWTYFRVRDDVDAMNFVRNSLVKVKNFLDGKWPKETPRLYCNDQWLTELERVDDAWDTAKEETIMKQAPDGSYAPISIQDVDDYMEDLWEENPNGIWSKNNKIPYWSDDLKEYVFDISYGSKTYCTSSKLNLAATQQQTIPNTVTLCLSSFSNPQAVDGLGSAEPRPRLSIMKILPRSATIYHELFHLTSGNDETPDLTYKWTDQARFLRNSPNTIPRGYYEDYTHLVRRNPETYVFFSVGYWYFQQTRWTTAANQRWSFHSGAAEMVSI